MENKDAAVFAAASHRIGKASGVEPGQTSAGLSHHNVFPVWYGLDHSKFLAGLVWNYSVAGGLDHGRDRRARYCHSSWSLGCHLRK